MQRPDFIIIGAAKSGTTTLYQYLCQHPQIYMSTPKEPEFFARDEIYARGLDWYNSLFKEATVNQVCGEASTLYSLSPYFPNSAERIARSLPHVKLIYIMRHPVERAYSFYAQLIKNAQNTGGESKVSKSFEACLEEPKMPDGSLPFHTDPVNAHLPQCPGIYLDGSRYLFQINRYLRWFSRESFLFILMEDLLASPVTILRQVCDFLDVDSHYDFLKQGYVAANTASSHNQWFLRSQITAPLKAIPGLTAIASVVPQNWRDNVYQVLRKLPPSQQIAHQYLPRPMTAATRQYLLEVFREPNRELASFLHRDLSHWNR